MNLASLSINIIMPLFVSFTLHFTNKYIEKSSNWGHVIKNGKYLDNFSDPIKEIYKICKSQELREVEENIKIKGSEKKSKKDFKDYVKLMNYRGSLFSRFKNIERNINVSNFSRESMERLFRAIDEIRKPSDPEPFSLKILDNSRFFIDFSFSVLALNLITIVLKNYPWIEKLGPLHYLVQLYYPISFILSLIVGVYSLLIARSYQVTKSSYQDYVEGDGNG